MTKINILLSFDYELPLGGITQSFENCLFRPTDELLQIAQKKEFPVNLFADIIGMQKVGENHPNEFLKPFKNQLQKAIQQGSDVQLHTHPHWKTTEIEDYVFKTSKDYAFDSFSKDEVKDIIKSSIEDMSSICKEADPTYECIAYRAGGYNFQPKDIVFSALYDNGIRIDSSIAKGYYFASGLSVIDFRKTPKEINWYESGENFNLFEIPIATIPKSVFETPTRFKLKKVANRAPEDRGRMIHDDYQAPFKEKLMQLSSSRMLTVDNYTYEFDYLVKILKYNLRKFYKGDKDIYLSLIGHPKSMSDYSFELLEKFIDYCRETYPDKVEFITYQKANKLIH